MQVSKETLESWYTPRVFENLTEEEEKVAVCDLCDGTGEIETFSFDLDSHHYQPDSTKTCICQLPEADDYNDQD